MKTISFTASEQKLLNAVQQVAPGTELRTALELIIAAGSGALIVIGENDKVLSISNGGFDLDAFLTSQRLFELAKMDGAIILSDDSKRIILANVHLVPDASLSTSETGIRHRTAERVSKQTGALVISISEQRGMISIYIEDLKYTLEDVRMVLAKANQALQTLEKYRYRLDQVLSSLSALEFQNLVTLLDVATALQRMEMVERIAKEIYRYIAQLGIDGRLIELQLDESMSNIEEDSLMLIEDYKKNSRRTADQIKRKLSQLNSDELLDLNNFCSVLGYKDFADMAEVKISPKGYRLLTKIPRLPSQVIHKLCKKFSSLEKLLQASIEELDDVEGVGEIRAHAIKDGLKRLREYNFFGRYA